MIVQPGERLALGRLPLAGEYIALATIRWMPCLCEPRKGDVGPDVPFLHDCVAADHGDAAPVGREAGAGAGDHAGGRHPWSTRSLARQLGMSQSAISRIWRAFGLKPHLVDTFKLSTDPQFVEKVRDIVGLYLNPPQAAMV